MVFFQFLNGKFFFLDIINCGTVDEALSELEKGTTIDLILCDISIRESANYEFIKQLKEKAADIPIISL